MEELISRWVMRLLARRSKSAPGQLEYSRPFKVFSVGITVVTAAGIGALSLAIPLETTEDWMALAVLIALMPGVGLWLVVESLGVRHRFSADGIDFKSPWSKRRFAAWTDVDALRWRKTSSGSSCGSAAGA